MESEAEGSETGAEIGDTTSLPLVKRWALYSLVLVFVGALVSIVSGNFGVGILLYVLLCAASLLYVYTLTDAEKQWFSEKRAEMEAEYAEGYQESLEDLDRPDGAGDRSGDGDIVSVCRECREEVSPDVKRCPHCGWKPKKRGGLWWGTTAVMSMNPIGWALGAKGASDHIKASKGVSEQTTAAPEGKKSEDSDPSEADPIERLERLNDLKEQGVIDESEFEAKKEELLEQV